MQIPKTIIFLGPQGSGKGTQAKLLKQFLEEHHPEVPIIHFDTGQKFRNLMTVPSYSISRIKDSINRGDLQPDWLPNWVFATEVMDSMSEPCQLIIDGIPRSVGQAKVVDEILSYYERDIIDVVLLEVPEDLSLERLIGRGRADDSKEAILYRLRQYEETTKPVISYFKSLPNRYFVHQINGAQHIEKVTQDIFYVLGLK